MRGFRCGVLCRWGGCWIGGHWSPHNKRLCLNFVPFVTLWVTAPGGITPRDEPNAAQVDCVGSAVTKGIAP